MTDDVTYANDAASLLQAVELKRVNIKVTARIAELASLKLPAGTTLRGTKGG